MATVSITVPAGDLSTTLASSAGESGYTADAAGVKNMVLDFLKQKYQNQKHVEAQRAVAATIDTAVNTAITNASGLS